MVYGLQSRYSLLIVVYGVQADFSGGVCFPGADFPWLFTGHNSHKDILGTPPRANSTQLFQSDTNSLAEELCPVRTGNKETLKTQETSSQASYFTYW